MKKSKNILVCPLNWGLGHTSRVVPIIFYLIEKGYDVILAADIDIINFLKCEFPNIKTLLLPSYKVKFSKRKSQLFVLLALIPKILYHTIKEHFLLKKIIVAHNIDIVISDNRYGLWNKHVHSIFITHQSMIKLPNGFKIFEYSLYLFIRLLVSRFDRCWIPDFNDIRNLSGDLSHKYPISPNAEFIGPLSRFLLSNENITTDNKIDILCVLSGPEPQRSIFESILLKQLSNVNKKIVLVRGTNIKAEDYSFKNNITVFDICNSNKLKKLILSASVIICRSGYSSVMDLMALNKKAILVPTPGQTEQEYLANYLQKQNWFYYERQNYFDVNNALGKCRKYSCNDIFNSHELLLEAINNIVATHFVEKK